jgi:hypothetical protein
MSVELTKNRIRNIVFGYKELFPNEYGNVVKFIANNRRLQENEFASMKQEHAVIQRALYELPEKLSTMLFQELSGEELTYFKSKQGGRWFAKTFPQFALSVKI